MAHAKIQPKDEPCKFMTERVEGGHARDLMSERIPGKSYQNVVLLLKRLPKTGNSEDWHLSL